LLVIPIYPYLPIEQVRPDVSIASDGNPWCG
jgi:hypothetical protein